MSGATKKVRRLRRSQDEKPRHRRKKVGVRRCGHDRPGLGTHQTEGTNRRIGPSRRTPAQTQKTGDQRDRAASPERRDCKEKQPVITKTTESGVDAPPNESDRQSTVRLGPAGKRRRPASPEANRTWIVHDARRRGRRRTARRNRRERKRPGPTSRRKREAHRTSTKRSRIDSDGAQPAGETELRARARIRARDNAEPSPPPAGSLSRADRTGGTR